MRPTRSLATYQVGLNPSQTGLITGSFHFSLINSTSAIVRCTLRISNDVASMILSSGDKTDRKLQFSHLVVIIPWWSLGSVGIGGISCSSMNRADIPSQHQPMFVTSADLTLSHGAAHIFRSQTSSALVWGIPKVRVQLPTTNVEWNMRGTVTFGGCPGGPQPIIPGDIMGWKVENDDDIFSITPTNPVTHTFARVRFGVLKKNMSGVSAEITTSRFGRSVVRTNIETDIVHDYRLSNDECGVKT